ncbi:hypothetical protein NCCP2165_02480 [Halomonas sp. NCCP-2165]|nr:hypothetical protein NCCP2165_02480 [Halomonas sp. NCCP-2165]
MVRAGVVLVTALLGGCAGFGQIEQVEDLSPHQLRSLNSLELYESESELQGLSYTNIGRIKGLSCKGSAVSGSASREGAMTQLQIKAVLEEANGILFPTCSHDASVDWGNNCWESWVCVGEALRVER